MKKIISIVIGLILASVIIIPRFYNLGSQPPGIHIDEIGFAADAKAIAETGRDTWNQPLPLIFKAFGEWKAPGLVYSMVFWTKILSRMDSVVARLPSAIAGIAILLMLALTLEKFLPKKSTPIIIFTVFVLAFSPWHFDMSRYFYEAFSALAFFSIGLYFVSTITMARSYNLKLWVAAALFDSLAGYWYASIRLVILLCFLIFTLVQDWSTKLKLKSGLIAFLIITIVGIGWIGDLFSDKGLNRLYQNQAQTASEDSLVINENRQFCYLSYGRDASDSKWCYFIWNKPVERVTAAIKTYVTYLGTDYLFVKIDGEFGFDSEYGAYLFPLLPLYLVGLVALLGGIINMISFTLGKKSTTLTERDRLYTIFVMVSLISLAPAAVVGAINMRMCMIALYIAALTIGIGAEISYNYLSKYLGKTLKIIVCLVYGGILTFYTLQSLAHYFLVFTHSNDSKYLSDVPQISSYIKSVSGGYDRIIYSESYGPLAAYFYDDITTEEIQNGSHSKPNEFGFTFLTSAGKYELQNIDIINYACKKLDQDDKSRTLIVTSPVSSLSSIRKFASRSWNGALLLHEVYDVDDIIANQLKNNPSFSLNCGAKLK